MLLANWCASRHDIAWGTFFGGTAFRPTLTSGSWTNTILWSADGAGDGTEPWAPINLKGGALYGTTQMGGPYSAGIVYQNAYGCFEKPFYGIAACTSFEWMLCWELESTAVTT